MAGARHERRLAAVAWTPFMLTRHDWYTSTAVDSLERRNHLRMIQEFFYLLLEGWWYGGARVRWRIPKVPSQIVHTFHVDLDDDRAPTVEHTQGNIIRQSRVDVGITLPFVQDKQQCQISGDRLELLLHLLWPV